MSATVTGAGVLGSGVLPAGAPVSRRVRAWFAPIDRSAAGQAGASLAVFDPAQMGGLDPDGLPAPWVDLGDCRGFVRRSGTKVEAVRAGSPGTAREQVRTEVEATIEVLFAQWGKLQLALSAGVQQLNVLAPAPGAAMSASGGVAVAAVPLVLTDGGVALPPGTATTLPVGATAAALFPVGTIVAVDADYAGQTGFVGAGASGGYLVSGAVADADYLRRVTLNVGVVASVSGGVLTLASPLIAGSPTAAMKVSAVVGFADREGGGFFQEWTGLFCSEGEQGDRVWFFYPRLQAMAGAAEQAEVLEGPLAQMRLRGVFRALATKDSSDGSQALCYRSYLPAAMRMV